MSAAPSSPQKVTVYIPAYNVAEFLARAIDSLRNQTLPPAEILVVDDGSTDNSAEIAAGYPQVTLLRHDQNKGLGAARNTALHAANSELLAALDADCVAAATWLAELAANLSDAAIVGVGGKLIEGVKNTTADEWRAVHMPQHWGDTAIRDPRFLFGCNNLFRRSALLAAGGYDERMRTNGEDVDLCARLRQNHGAFFYAPSAVVTHLRHDTTSSILNAYWRWWRFGVNAYAQGSRLRSVLGHALKVHFRYNFLEPFKKDIRAHRWKLAAFDLLILLYFPYMDFQLWWKVRQGPTVD
ncbi:MAG TPA: glycosyltransferase [Candidatus Sulfotelmatobacter sp.]|nr:glycosyltransferase [Candidatus Sulfotelmatobacter sp.]